MAKLIKIIKNCNQTEGVPSSSAISANSNPAAGSDYDAATISGIVFGIFMALLAIYSIWQYGQQYKRFCVQLLGQGVRDIESVNSADIEIEHIDIGHERNNHEVENEGSEEP